MLGLTMGLGRLSGQFLATRLGAARLIAGSALLGVIGALVVALAPMPGVAVLGVALIGLGVAVVVPSANSLLGQAVAPDQRAYAISRSWMIGFTGFFLGPVGMGLIAETLGLRWSFVAVALALALILPGLARLAPR
jgi:MFS family permease